MKGNKLIPLLQRGDGSTLSLDFAQMGGLDSRFTFTRNSIATFINSSGLVEQVSAAPSNDPTKARFDYNPTTLAARGLLIEASATNICTRSEDFANAVWVVDNGSATNPSVSVVSQAAPNGGASVNRITFNKTGGTFSRVRQPLVGTSGATHTFSVWMKANTASGGASTQNVGLRIGADSAGFNCVVTTTWKRFSYSYALSGADASAQIMLWDNIVGNDETADVLVWGAQIEEALDASSYIPTGISSVQRAADVCTMSGTNFSSWFNSTEGTFLATGERAITSTFGRLLSANANNTTSAFDLGASTSGRWLITNTTSQADITAGTVTANTAFKVAGAFANNDAQMAFNGTLGTADASVSLPTVSQLNIGADRTAVYLNGRIRSIKFWPTRLPNATLQSLTA